MAAAATQGCRSRAWGARGGGMPLQDFDRSVDQGEGQIIPSKLAKPPGFTHLPTALQPTNHLYKLMDWCENCVW